MKRLILIPAIIISFAAFCLTASAQLSPATDGGTGSGDPTVNDTNGPSEKSFQIVPCDGVAVGGGVECDFNSVIILINRILRYFIYLFVPISTVALMYIGFKFIISGDNVFEKTKAKTMFMNVAIGIFFILAAWLIVSAIMRNFLADEFKESNTFFGAFKELFNSNQ